MNDNRKRNLWLGILLSVCSALVGSCVHDIPEPMTEDTGNNGGGTDTPVTRVCSADTVYFTQSVLPLVTSLCGKSGCHGTISHREFQLIYGSDAQSYSAIRNRFSTTNRLNNALNEMAGENVTGYVKPTSSQLATLQKWISQGLQNNSCAQCDTTQFTYALAIAPIINSYCVGCHPSPGSSSTPNLSSVTAIQAELTNFPGRLIASVEWKAPYNTTTTRMPQGGAQLSTCQITQIRKWAEAGALNN